MTRALHSFLETLIDYAGMFPPARLPMAEAIRNYAGYRAGPDAWMLGPFICQTTKLEQLKNHACELFTAAAPLVVSALGQSGGYCADFLKATEADFQAIEEFRENEIARVDVVELRLPQEFTGLAAGDAGAFLGETAAILGANPRAGGRLFFEIALGDDWRERVVHILAALRALNEKRNPKPTDGARWVQHVAGIKLRCGGLEASAFPSPEQIAFCLRQCLDHQVPFKATAGLHHPIRRFAPEVQATMHGFVNVFSAGVLAHIHNLSEDRIAKILSDEDARNFEFSAERFVWKEWQATSDEISAARREFMISFGSCSFEEPREDMRQLGWI